MYEAYVTCVDDERVGTHDHNDPIDYDHDDNIDSYGHNNDDVCRKSY